VKPAGESRRARLAALALAALAAAAVSFAGIGSHSLWTPDEPRDAAIGKAMWVSGDLVVPRLNGRPFLEKPPLAWWAQTVSFRLFGVSDAAARVPSALFATLTLLVTFAVARRLGGARAGWLAAGALAATVEFSEDMGRAIVDPPLVLMVTLAYAGFVLLVSDGRDAGGTLRQAGGRGAGAERWGAYLLIALAVPLAFLAKGVVGIGLTLGPPVLYLLLAGAAAGRARTRPAGKAEGSAAMRRGLAGTMRRRPAGPEPRGFAATMRRRLAGPEPRGFAGTVRLLAPLALLAVPLFAAVVLPWALALLREGGWAALRECLIGNTVDRLLATEAGRALGHRQPFWYYLPAGAVAFLPWTLALPAMLRSRADPSPATRPIGLTVAGACAPAHRQSAESGRRLLLASSLIGVLLLSLAASKRSLYLVPLLPALAVPLGLWLDGLGRAERSRWDRPTALLLLTLAAFLPPTLWLGAWGAGRGVWRSFPAAPLRAELTGTHLAAAGLAAVAVAALLLCRGARHLRTATTPAGAWLVLPFLTIALAYQIAVKAAIEPLKSPHDLTAAVARLDPGTAPVAAYRPSETTLGIIGFDLGRQVRSLSSPAEVAALFSTQPADRLVLSLDALRHLPAPLRARLRLLYDETATKASPFVIATGDGANRAGAQLIR